MFAAKMIELDEKLRHLHERIDDGEHEDITVDLLLRDCPACTGCIQLLRLPAFIIASGD